jgi:excinuclease ABC subunit B
VKKRITKIWGVYSKSDENIKRNEILRQLVSIQYERNDIAFYRGQFKVQGRYHRYPSGDRRSSGQNRYFGNDIESIRLFNVKPDAKKPVWAADLNNTNSKELEKINILPAKHFMTPEERMQAALENIRQELSVRLKSTQKRKKSSRGLPTGKRKTNYDLEMMEELGYCNGIENYSRHLSGRNEGEPPSTLMDFFPDDYLMFVDESHVTIPQIRGMHAGDQARKQNLVDFGFRLPSARDNRPLNFDEWNGKIKQVIYVSATPGEYEIRNSSQVVEQIIRPTGLLDPEVEVRKNKGQIPDLISEIEKRTAKNQRVLVTTLTKRMAEELAEYLAEERIKVQYLHSEIEHLGAR